MLGLWFGKLAESQKFRGLRSGGSVIRATFLGLLLVVGALVVGSGDLDAFQDVWLPNHAQLLSEVEGDVVQLGDWYQGQIEFGIAVPSYMTDVTTMGDLNPSNVHQIYGIEPGSVIMERIPEEVEPVYNLQPKLVESRPAGMLSEVDRLYNEEEEFAFIGWRPHGMNRVYDFKYLEDPQDALGELNDSATGRR